MDLPDKKGIGIIGGAYGMIKGDLQKKEINRNTGTVQSERIAGTAVTVPWRSQSKTITPSRWAAISSPLGSLTTTSVP